MMKTCRTLAAAALVVLAASCGGESAARLTLGQSSSESRSANSGAAMSDSKVGWWAPYGEYVAGDELSDPKWMDGIGRRRSYRYVASTRPGKELSRIAGVLGVPGDVKEDPSNKGYWSNDVMPGSPMFSSWGDAHGRWWSYSASVISVGTAQGSSGSGSSGSASSEPCAPDTKDCAVVPPIDTVPPADNLPTKNEAREAAVLLLGKLGVDTSSGALSVDVQADDWSVRVSATALVDGEATWVRSWYLGYGSDARLTDASGSLVTPEEADSYPVITPVEAVARLAKGLGSAGTYGTGAVTKDVASGSVAPDDSGTPAPKKIELVSARISLVDWTMSDGTQMLLPAWALADADGNEVKVVAVSDDYIDWPTPASDAPAPVPQPEPTPGTDVPAAAVRTADAEKLVGLTEDEAAKVASGAGWTVRVVSRDGEDFMVTADWQENRVNISVVDGKVTAVTVG